MRPAFIAAHSAKTADLENSARVTGRFAPSPTGPLHFGSVVAAVASYLSARSVNGRWLVRIDDLDAPRKVAGADSEILRLLEALDLLWDGPVTYQSQRNESYQEALSSLFRQEAVYPCSCTRAMVGRRPYPGTCRAGSVTKHGARALRVRIPEIPVEFVDRVQGAVTQDLSLVCGDFVVRRSDGLWAYHLATIVDDADAGVTEVVRGSDLLDSTPRQIHLSRLLNLPEPSYAHFGVVTDTKGIKLSKQSQAPPVAPGAARMALYHALNFLNLAPPEALLTTDCRTMLDWALGAWHPTKFPRAGARSPLQDGRLAF